MPDEGVSEGGRQGVDVRSASIRREGEAWLKLYPGGQTPWGSKGRGQRSEGHTPRTEMWLTEVRGHNPVGLRAV